jgi:hypothetical protein
MILDANGHSLASANQTGRSGYSLGYFELSHATNTTIKNLRFAMNCELQILNSTNCNILNSTFPSIIIKNSHNIQLSKTHRFLSQCTFLLYNSHNCTIQQTNLLFQLINSHHNKIQNNQISAGFQVMYFENSCSNLIFHNQIDDDARKLISITGHCTNNLFVANTFANFAHYEPTFSHTGTNTFYHNNFQNAHWLQTDPNFTKSKWDNGQTGNYWSNYNGTDTNNDNVGDTPHIIDLNNKDNYPLINPINTQQEIQPNLPPYK